ncbi:MAG: helix-turn-helix domain-containing protein [Archangium sp.]
MNRRMLASRFFEDSVVMNADANGDLRMDAVPDGRTRIALMVTQNRVCTGLWVVGPRTSALFKTSHGIEQVAVATIKPGWATALLDVPASELTDQTVRLQTLWGEDALPLTCAISREPDAIAEHFATAALARVRKREESSSARLARHAVRMLDAEQVPVGSVAERLGVTSRHLRRTFVENVGVGPKEFARATRLQRALKLAEKTTDWGDVANTAGYFDQSHFTTDFKALMGVTPTRFERRAVVDYACGL